MFPFFRYRKNGLPHALIHIHDVLLKDFIDYFENGKECRRGINQVRKAVKNALKLAKKKKINPGISIGEAREALVILRKELEHMRSAVSITATNLINALNQIEEERIDGPLSLIENAREHFRNKEIERGLELLKESQSEFQTRMLVKTRTAFFGGTSNEVKDLKEQIEAYRAQSPPAR